MNSRRRLAAVLVAGATATMIGVGGAGAAQAAPTMDAGTAATGATTSRTAATNTAVPAVAEYARLSIRPLGSGNYSITVSGRVNLAQPTPASYSIKLLGEDPWFDDTPFCEEWPLNTNVNGGFWHQYTCPGSLLNEDWDGQDEVYAKVTVYESGKYHRLRSNTVKGHY
jgi:hypothetical protein